MKNKKKTLFLSAALTVCFIFSVFTFAADSEYDSMSDPLISYSYLEARLGELKTNYENEITSLTLENEALREEVDTLNESYETLLNVVNTLVGEIDKLKNEGGGSVGTGTPDTSVTPVEGYTEAEIREIAADVALNIANYVADERLGTEVLVDLGYEVILVPGGSTVYPAGDNLEVIVRAGQTTVVSPFADQGLSNITNGTDMLNGKSITTNHLLLIPRNDGRGVCVLSEGGAYMMIRGEYRIG